MLFSLSIPELTPTCTNQQFTKTVLVAWNWQIILINFAHEQNTLASNGITFAMLSRTAVLWLRRLPPACNLLILSQNLCHNLDLNFYNICSWVGNTVLVSCASLFFTKCFLFPPRGFLSHLFTNTLLLSWLQCTREP